MNAVDALVVALLAIADLCFLVQLRRARARRLRTKRMTRSLQLSVQRELATQARAQLRRWSSWSALRRAG